MKKALLPVPNGAKARYGAPQSRIIRISVKAPIMSLSDPTPGAAGYYNSDDDIVIPDAF